MKWKEMQKKWPTLEAYEKDLTAFEVVTSRGYFVAAVVAAACLVSAVVGLTSWSWFFWAVAGVVVLFVANTASIAWRKALKRDMTPVAQQEAFQALNEALTPEAVDDIVSKMGDYIAHRHARYGREADLPVHKNAIELAFLKAIRDSTEPARREALKSVYITLDEYMLNDEDCAILTAFRDFLDQSRASSMSEKALAEELTGSLEMGKALAIKQRLTEAMNRRFEVLDKFSRQAE